jgi:hypothetical protein
MILEPAQVKLVGGHRLGLEPARSHNVALLDAAKHRRGDARNHLVEPVDQAFKALVAPIAPDYSAGFGL